MLGSDRRGRIGHHGSQETLSLALSNSAQSAGQD
jgi:hypothetical protein